MHDSHTDRTAPSNPAARIKRGLCAFGVALCVGMSVSLPAFAQLGGIGGDVTDTVGDVVDDTTDTVDDVVDDVSDTVGDTVGDDGDGGSGSGDDGERPSGPEQPCQPTTIPIKRWVSRINGDLPCTQ